MSISPTLSEVDSALTLAVDNIKRRVDAYIASSGNVPKKSGNLQNSGRKNLKLSIGGLGFSILIDFDVPYASEVDKRTGFFTKVEAYATRVASEEFHAYLSAAGIESTVII